MAPIDTPATQSWTKSVTPRPRSTLFTGADVVGAAEHSDRLDDHRLLVLHLDDEARPIETPLLVHVQVHEEAGLLGGGEHVVVEAGADLGLIPAADPLHGRLPHVHADIALERVVVGDPVVL